MSNSDAELLKLEAEYVELHARTVQINNELGMHVSAAAEARYDAEVEPRIDRMWAIEEIVMAIRPAAIEGMRAKARVCEVAMLRGANDLTKTFEEQAAPCDALAMSLIRDILGGAPA